MLQFGNRPKRTAKNSPKQVIRVDNDSLGIHRHRALCGGVKYLTSSPSYQQLLSFHPQVFTNGNSPWTTPISKSLCSCATQNLVQVRILVSTHQGLSIPGWSTRNLGEDGKSMENQGVISKLQGKRKYLEVYLWQKCGIAMGCQHPILDPTSTCRYQYCNVPSFWHLRTYGRWPRRQDCNDIGMRLYYTNISADKDSRDKILTSSIDANKHHPRPSTVTP